MCLLSALCCVHSAWHGESLPCLSGQTNEQKPSEGSGLIVYRGKLKVVLLEGAIGCTKSLINQC